MCTCAVAVRAAADVYVVNVCSKEEEEFDFTNCLDHVLDVRKVDPLNYIVRNLNICDKYLITYPFIVWENDFDLWNFTVTI